MERLKKALHKKLTSAKFPNIRRDHDPSHYWEILEELGGGTFGQVMRLRHREDGRQMAAKICHVDSEADLERLSAEADVLSGLHHRNIVRLVDSCYSHRNLWIFLELCHASLDRAMEALGRGLCEDQVAAVGRQLCEAVDHLHGRDVIHRDIKASNVLLATEGRVKLADFGAAVRSSGGGRRSEKV